MYFLKLINSSKSSGLFSAFAINLSEDVLNNLLKAVNILPVLVNCPTCALTISEKALPNTLLDRDWETH